MEAEAQTLKSTRRGRGQVKGVTQKGAMERRMVKRTQFKSELIVNYFQATEQKEK